MRREKDMLRGNFEKDGEGSKRKREGDMSFP